MKILAIGLLLMAATQAFAQNADRNADRTLVTNQPPGAQENCSNADGTLSWHNHPKSNVLLVSKREIVNGREYERWQEIPNFAVEILGRRDMDTQVFSECAPDQEMGTQHRKLVRYVRARFTNMNGSLFPEGLVGVTPDRLAIDVHMICEQIDKFEALCRP